MSYEIPRLTFSVFNPKNKKRFLCAIAIIGWYGIYVFVIYDDHLVLKIVERCILLTIHFVEMWSFKYRWFRKSKFLTSKNEICLKSVYAIFRAQNKINWCTVSRTEEPISKGKDYGTSNRTTNTGQAIFLRYLCRNSP